MLCYVSAQNNRSTKRAGAATVRGSSAFEYGQTGTRLGADYAAGLTLDRRQDRSCHLFTFCNMPRENDVNVKLCKVWEGGGVGTMLMIC